MKRQGRKIAMLTAYDYTFAGLLDGAGIDVILVGDSLGMVMLGYETTVPVTMDEMVHHTRAVTRGVRRAMVVADMPFGSYQTGLEEGLRNAARLLKEGLAQAVKIEGGGPVVRLVEALTQAGIPVMGHLGLTPQSVHQLGGYRVQGKSRDDAARILDDARALEAAGAFSLVAECLPEELVAELSRALAIPVIGIGAGVHCDGQVLVLQDMLGLFTELSPRFVKRYAELSEQATAAVTAYAEEVRSGAFPGPEHSFQGE
jgi:3-methyl-2-oxobutanoate hydroxymethyltransferase